MSYYKDNHIDLYNKDCRQMTELADNSVQCVVTSPPYWGLRKYSGEQELIWLPLGKGKDCEHQWGDTIPNPMAKSGKHGPASTIGAKDAQHEVRKESNQGSFCSLCGAWKGAYGLEPTPEMYVQHTIEILREIKRVLRKDGVVFWNIGDSYGSGKGTCFNPGGGKGSFSGHGDRKDAGAYPLDRGNISMLKASGLKPKDLCLIPFRIAIAAQEDGWWVRSVIIWSKPNPMPESVTDRPTESHEYVLMLTKSARYYWDADAVREKNSDGSIERFGITGEGQTRKWNTTNNKRDGRDDGTKSAEGFRNYVPIGRNIRTVWEFPTQPYPEAHFAVFPEKLPELCIKAATPEVGCCSKCGAPWERVIEKTGHINKREPAHVPNNTPTKTDSTGWSPVAMATNSWQTTCKCNADKVPSIVLDPFAGAGTTLWVAKKLNRRAVGYEISQEYCQLAVERNRQQVLV